MVNAEDVYYAEVISKASFVIGLWYFNKAETPEEFTEYIKRGLDKNQVEVDNVEEEKKEELAPDAPEVKSEVDGN